MKLDLVNLLKKDYLLIIQLLHHLNLIIFGDTGYDANSLSFDFYLINKNEDWLLKNFQFLHAFFAGTQWLQMPMGFIQGTNVYNVLCPGRFNILWASVGATITCEGKLRKNKFISDKFIGTINSITEDTLWPDAWKLDIKVQDLTPNNFNTYINYFVNGHEANFKELNAKHIEAPEGIPADKWQQALKNISKLNTDIGTYHLLNAQSNKGLSSRTPNLDSQRKLEKVAKRMGMSNVEGMIDKAKDIKVESAYANANAITISKNNLDEIVKANWNPDENPMNLFPLFQFKKEREINQQAKEIETEFKTKATDAINRRTAAQEKIDRISNDTTISNEVKKEQILTAKKEWLSANADLEYAQQRMQADYAALKTEKDIQSEVEKFDDLLKEQREARERNPYIRTMAEAEARYKANLSQYKTEEEVKRQNEAEAREQEWRGEHPVKGFFKDVATSIIHSI